MKCNKTIISLLTSSVLILGTVTPGIVSAQSLINGNGAFSDSTAVANTTNSMTTSQNNTASVNNTVTSAMNTGGNSADNATGGNVSILTGDASSNVQIANEANRNQASSMSTPQAMGSNAVISGNGTSSDNQVFGTNSNSASLSQNNDALLNNSVTTNANTGWNSANNATGGDVAIRTGSAGSSVGILNAANTNTANMGNVGENNGGGSFAGIGQNGAFSDNTISLNNLDRNTATQNNAANVNNTVTGNLSTGNNSADNGTNGGASIATGNAYAFTNVVNRVNANNAQVESNGGSGDWNKVIGNGAYSNNQFFDTNSTTHAASQNNDSTLNNDVFNTMATGNNSLNNATGGLYAYSNPSTRSGGAYQQSNVQNQANSNTLGSFDIGGTHFTMSFDPMGIFGN